VRDFPKAEAVLRECLEVREATMPPGHWRIHQAGIEVAQCVANQERFAEAEHLLDEHYPMLMETDAHAWHKWDLTHRAIRIYESWEERPGRLAEYYERAIEIYESGGLPASDDIANQAAECRSKLERLRI
jgi:hypothetical protein